MRFIDRQSVDEPQSLSGPSGTVAEEKARAATFYTTYDPEAPKAKGYKFEAYKPFDVVAALTTMTNNKCAYCEDDLRDVVEVEHFRPKGRVEEDRRHPGYWWLAHNWRNLLPSCITCNQKRAQHLISEQMTAAEVAALLGRRSRQSHGKGNQFPIGGVRAYCGADDLAAEQPLILDPTVEDPKDYLRWSSIGHHSVVLPDDDPARVDRATTTIKVFALNRVRLVQTRTRILAELRHQRLEIISELEQASAPGQMIASHLQRALERVEALRRLHGPTHPFSAMVKAFVDSLARELAGRVAGAAPAD